MRSKHMFQVTSLPLSLGQPMTSVLAHQAEVYNLSSLPPSRIARMLYDTSDFTRFELRVLESQKRFYNPSRVKRTYAGFRRWAQRRVLRLDDAKAREVIGEALGIDDLDGLAELMEALNAHDAELVTLLLSGRLGDAIRRVPAKGYGAEGAHDRWNYGEVMDLIDIVIRLWIANDLQMEAAAAHVRLFRPTGCEVMDGGFNGKAPVQGSVLLRLQREIELLGKAIELYFKRPDAGDGAEQAGAAPARQGAQVGMPGHNLLVMWPSDASRVYGRDATAEEAAVFRAPDLDLEPRAKVMLGIWAAEHGDQLENYLDSRMRQARRMLRELEHETNAIRRDESRRRQRVHVLKGLHPLDRLWLACERAVAWTGPVDKGERAIDRAAAQTLDLAMQAARSRHSIVEPRIAKHNVRRAQELFFTLRCTIVRDPAHLPKGLLEVTLDTGQAETGKSRDHAEELRGRPFGFEEIYAHQLARMKTERNGEEVFSHDFTKSTNKFVEQHRRKPTPESRQIIEHAWGTVSWRLK